MTERPILFSGPMVKVIREGQKTQTRRIAKLTTNGHVREPRGHRRWHPGDPNAAFACPFGQPGDRLWVRESFRFIGWDPDNSELSIRYEADGTTRWVQVPEDADPDGDVFNRHWEQGTDDLTVAGYEWDEDADETPAMWRGEGPEPAEAWPFMRLRPSIFMPQWASRIALTITNVHIERLQDITANDARAEGLTVAGEGMGMPMYDCGALPIGGYGRTTDPTEAFMYLWDGLNAKRGQGWGTNPLVWVVRFSLATAGAGKGDDHG